jgi:hypothetical protein
MSRMVKCIFLVVTVLLEAKNCELVLTTKKANSKLRTWQGNAGKELCSWSQFWRSSFGALVCQIFSFF